MHRPHDLGHFFGVRLPALLQYCCICAQGNPSVSTHAMVGAPVGAAVGRAVGADVGATATINNNDTQRRQLRVGQRGTEKTSVATGCAAWQITVGALGSLQSAL